MEEICEAKAQLKLKLASTVKDNKKGFLKYINGKREARNNIGLLLEENDHLTSRDIDKAGMFNAFFVSVFNTDGGLRDLQSPRLVNHDCGNDKLLINPKLVQDLLLQLDACKSMGPDKTPRRVLQRAG